MKETIKKSLVWWIVFCLPILTLFIAYATTTYYTDLPQVSSWSVLSSSSWNNLVNYVNKAVKQDSEVLTVTGGKVGIGTTSPDEKLTVNGNLNVTGDIYSNTNWVNYSTATITGWSTIFTKEIYYQKIWKMVFVAFYIWGVSNSTIATLTLPYSVSSAHPTELHFPIKVADNGVEQSAAGGMRIYKSNNVASFYKDNAGNSFTTSGNKIVSGQFFYKID